MVPRVLSLCTIIFLLTLSFSARSDEVKGKALVRGEDPQQGSISETVNGHGTVEAETTKNESFQRDGMISEIYVEVGDQFKKGEKLLDFGASPAAVVAYEQAKTTLKLAEGTLARAQQRFKLKLATVDDIDTAEKAVSDAKMNKEMFEKIGSINPSEILEAPFDGVVTAIAVSKGDRIAAGKTLMTLAATDKLRLTVGVEAGDLEKVKEGQEVELQSQSRNSGPVKVTVRRTGRAIDPNTRLVPIFLEFPPGEVLLGEKVEAKILVGETRGWLVPRDAVGYGAKGAFVFQVDEAHAKRVYVNVVGSDGDTSVVKGDIDPQLKLVVRGNYQLDDGDAVRTESAEGEAKNSLIRND
jgi:RND family efflux transporter MFP subunit